MNLTIPDLMCNIDFEEDFFYEIVIENPIMFSKITGDFYAQVNSKEGNIILSEDNKEIAISKFCEMIWNPFAVDINNKKIMSILYQEMQDICNTLYMEQSNAINSSLVNFFDSVIEEMPYNLDYLYDIDWIGLFKLFKVGISEETESLVNRLIDYLKVVKKALGIILIVFIDIKSYLNSDELEELYKSASYEKISILNITSKEHYKSSKEKRFLIDKDLCFIDLN